MGTRKRLALLMTLLLMGVIVTAVDTLYLFPKRPAPGKGEARLITVEKGIGPRKLSHLLYTAGITNSPGRFNVWLRLTGGLTIVKAGEFEIRDNLTPEEVIETLSGRTTHKGTRVLIPEGFRLTQIADALEKAGILSGDRFLQTATDLAVATRLGLPGPTLEGYLFPDTYYFDPGLPAETLVRIMTDNFKAHIADAGIDLDDRLKDTVILASIVQSETGRSEEMPIVAGVYMNRLADPGHPSKRLQADPTVAYGCEPFVRPRAPSCDTFKGILGRRQLDDEVNPYNTYKRPGLPPGPICAPGIDALKAASHPQEVPFLYFVASPQGDGRHVFSTTLEAHEKAVEKWRARASRQPREMTAGEPGPSAPR